MIKKMAQRILIRCLDPYVLRLKSLQLFQKYELGNYEQRLAIGAVERPHYGYCIYQAALLALNLGYRRISVLELGVAGGNGLLNIEYHVAEISKLLPIDIEIYGFDTGTGLPKPDDYRDLPYHWKESFYSMDVALLKAKLKKAILVLGDIKKTTQDFYYKYKPAPIAAIMFDLDFYSSTAAAFRIFSEGNEQFYLPRVYCYFDDLIGSEIELYNEFTGVRLAIIEFNQEHKKKKITKAYHLLGRRIVETWYQQIYIFHDFEHSKYNQFISQDRQQLPLVLKKG